MYKKDLIKLHQMLSDIKEDLKTINPGLEFPQYNSLKITPYPRYYNKMEQKHAIFVLGLEIADAIADADNKSSKRISSQMKKLADKCLSEN